MNWKANPKTHKDPETGLKVTQLIGDEERDRIIYFNYNSFFDGSRKFAFTKTMDGKAFPAFMDLETCEFTQLAAPEVGFAPSFVDPVKNLCFGICNRNVCSINLKTGEMLEIYHIPDGYSFSFTSAFGGEYIVGYLTEIKMDYNPKDTSQQKSGIEYLFENPPHCIVLRFKYNGDDVETLFETDIWTDHVNVSPVNDKMFTFAHEGPWQLVDNRIWAMDLRKKPYPEPYKLRERTEPKEMIGHEWWTADGKWVCYQSHRKNRETIGMVNFENNYTKEIDIVGFSTTTHSITDHLFVLDTCSFMPYLRAVKILDDGVTIQDKILCHHGSDDWSIMEGHPCAAMAPNEKFAIYNSIRSGIGKMEMVEIPEDLSDLPDAKDFLARYQK